MKASVLCVLNVGWWGHKQQNFTEEIIKEGTEKGRTNRKLGEECTPGQEEQQGTDQLMEPLIDAERPRNQSEEINCGYGPWKVVQHRGKAPVKSYRPSLLAPITEVQSSNGKKITGYDTAEDSGTDKATGRHSRSRGYRQDEG